ncbi:DNA alkylation repair protein [Paenibacillus harenae]|uniref:DNA alkylation repair protein n=1 Tax=Paenibacillus harenae TaxID=306543 RepID=UPI00278D0B19|nr:DNA alkylation repair protein [Paenibacillus harenae]MDQ0058492.1 3-methyladenine DNA glycosylase AlkD [Paenibacillus harenae]
MVNECAAAFEAWLRKHADPEQAGPMEAYMRNQFPFLGIRNPERQALTRELWKAHPLPKGDELRETALQLWNLPEREFHYTAMSLLEKYGKQAGEGHIEVLEKLVTQHSWWDTVDFIASHLIGRQLSQYPELVRDYPDRWINSDRLWLRRSAILFQLKYKHSTDFDRLEGYIERCKGESEFFIRKAIGWALREYAKTDAAAVRRYVASAGLSPLSEKEAMKHLR